MTTAPEDVLREALERIERGEGDSQQQAHVALVSAGLMEPDQWDSEETRAAFASHRSHREATPVACATWCGKTNDSANTHDQPAWWNKESRQCDICYEEAESKPRETENERLRSQVAALTEERDAARLKAATIASRLRLALEALEAFAGELEAARLYEIPGGQKVSQTPRWCGLGPGKRQLLGRFIDDMRRSLGCSLEPGHPGDCAV